MVDMEEIEQADLIGKRVAEQIKDVREKISRSLEELVWQACNDYVEYAKWEPLDNWRDRTRSELIRGDAWRKDDYWGKTMRRTILEEHKTELLPLLQNEIIAQQSERIAQLEESLAFERKLNRSYPGF